MRLQRASLSPPPGLERLLADLADGERGFMGTPVHGGETTLQEFLARCCDEAEGRGLRNGWVPQTVYWVLDDDGTAVGMVCVRHRLTADLAVSGGHIGFYIRSDRRGRGLARAAVRAALDELRDLGVRRALLTADPDNTASLRTIEAVGGRRHDVVDAKGGGKLARLWVELAATPGHTVVAAAPTHLAGLPHIELAAASLFRGWNVPPDLFTDTTPASVFAEAQASGHLWVALCPTGGCVGFALVEPSGERVHLEELDVLPEHGRRGVGTALVREIERWATARGYAEVTLTTYRDVPWNGPFYERLGYAVVRADDLDADLAARLEAEAARGLDSLPRVAMCRLVGRKGTL